MKKDNSKFQKQAPLLVFCLTFLFSDQPSKSSGCPFSEAKRKAAKVVKFVAMWLNLYPHTVRKSEINTLVPNEAMYHKIQSFQVTPHE